MFPLRVTLFWGIFFFPVLFDAKMVWQVGVLDYWYIIFRAWSEAAKLDRMLAPSDFAAQIEFSGLWVLCFGHWLMNVDTNVTSFEWPVTDTIVQYAAVECGLWLCEPVAVWPVEGEGNCSRSARGRGGLDGGWAGWEVGEGGMVDHRSEISGLLLLSPPCSSPIWSLPPF